MAICMPVPLSKSQCRVYRYREINAFIGAYRGGTLDDKNHPTSLNYSPVSDLNEGPP